MTTDTPRRVDAPVDGIDVAAATIATDAPESDGTLTWDSTTIVVVEARCGETRGLGWTYGSTACAEMVRDQLASTVEGRDAMDVPGAWMAMERAVRNSGRVGIAAMAISAVDIALWDLKARLLDVPLCSLLGRMRESAAIYGSGGFCSYSLERIADQLAGWAEMGIGRVKMKVGRDMDGDRKRVAAARDAIGEAVELYVDGNGAYSRQEALAWAEIFHDEFAISYFEEPVSSDDLPGLALLRDRSPAGLSIAAGEYGYDLPYFRDMVPVVDVQQADVTRCGGITGLLAVGALCQAHQVPFSAHCAPNVSAHPCCAIPTLAHIEYFHDHVRIEEMLFDGVLSPRDGALRPDLSRPGLGLELRRSELERYAAG
jgi:L-alanine-DL-glutamate epimerase-like enolase superfamily enzyme